MTISRDRAPAQVSFPKTGLFRGRERAVESGELGAFNQMMRELNAPAVGLEPAKPIG